MTYQETIDYLYAAQPPFHLVGAAAYKPGLDNMYALLAHIGNPHHAFKSVHIAGTNGKGSTSHLLAAALQCAGYKVGLYTSPHLVDFRERIRINGQVIPETEVVRFVEENMTFMEDMKPSFFETATAMAFKYFADCEVDIAVVETGLGGRLDATNVLLPELSVITNIGLDHTEFLGTTLPEIAAEKAGIIKRQVPVVVGEWNVLTAPVFETMAETMQTSLQYASKPTDDYLYRSDAYTFGDMYGNNGEEVRRMTDICQLKGTYQSHNIATALCALHILQNKGWTIPATAITEGFASVCVRTGLRGRWEVLGTSPLIVCDTGHNSHGIRYVADMLRAIQASAAKDAVLRVVFGMVGDKDVEAALALMPHKAEYYFTQPDTHRALLAADMLRFGCAANLQGRAFPDWKDALQMVMADSSPADTIFIGGSNYLVGCALKWFQS